MLDVQPGAWAAAGSFQLDQVIVTADRVLTKVVAHNETETRPAPWPMP